jgi:hypothetical protein
MFSRVGESASSKASVRSRLSQQPLLSEGINQPHSPRPTSDPDWNDLRRRVNQLELQGVHGYFGSPSLRPGRSPPHPPPRPSSAPTQHPDVDDAHYGARPRVTSFNSYRGDDAFHGWDQPPGLFRAGYRDAPPQVAEHEVPAHVLTERRTSDDPGLVPPNIDDQTASISSPGSSLLVLDPVTSLLATHPDNHPATVPADNPGSVPTGFTDLFPTSLFDTHPDNHPATVPADNPGSVPTGFTDLFSSSLFAAYPYNRPALFPDSLPTIAGYNHPASIPAGHSGFVPAGLSTSSAAGYRASIFGGYSTFAPAGVPLPATAGLLTSTLAGPRTSIFGGLSACVPAGRTTSPAAGHPAPFPASLPTSSAAGHPAYVPVTTATCAAGHPA